MKNISKFTALVMVCVFAFASIGFASADEPIVIDEPVVAESSVAPAENTEPEMEIAPEVSAEETAPPDDGEEATVVQPNAPDDAGCVPGEVIVAFEEGAAPEILRFAEEGRDIVRQTVDISGGPVSLVELAPGRSVSSAVEDYQRVPGVKYVQPNYIYKAMGAESGLRTNDPMLGEQWYMDKINAGGAWKIIDGLPAREKIRVAVLDTEINIWHEDLKASVNPALCIDASGDELAPYPTKGYEDHGTHVAGTVGAVANNGVGIAGVGSGGGNHVLELMCVRVLNAGFGSTLTIARGLDWAVQNGADVINMSLGGASNVPIHPIDRLLRDTCDDAFGSGVTLVAAAGNDASSDAHIPSDFESVISVIAAMPDGSKANFSNYGVDKDISAPGVDIFSTTPFAGELYGYMSGTSMASPIVAGVAAMVKYANPSLSAVEVKRILCETATDLNTPGYDIYTGWGNVDAAAAVAKAAGVDVNDDGDVVPGEIIVSLVDGAGWQGVSQALDNASINQISEEQGVALVETGNIPLQECIALLEALPEVEYAQPNFVYTASESIDPSDGTSQWYVGKIGADKAWAFLDNAKVPSAAKPRVAVIGSARARQIANVTANGIAELLTTEALDSGKATTASLLRSVESSITAGADIINICLSAPANPPYASEDRILREIIDTAYNYGIPVICAAGDDGLLGTSMPSDVMTAISVIATNNYASASENSRAAFSNYGQRKDISAPGVGIAAGSSSTSGTSAASGVVTGTVAMMKYANPFLSVEEITEILHTTATDLYTEGFDVYTGWGNVSANRAVEAAYNKWSVVDDIPPQNLTALNAGPTSVSLKWQASPLAAGYEVYRSDSGYVYDTTNYELVGEIEDGKTTSFTDKNGLVTGKEYHYYVAAVFTYSDQYLNLSAPSNIAGARPRCKAPASLSANGISSSAMRLKWGASQGADGYYIYRSLTKSGGYSMVKQTGADRLTLKDTGLKADTRYYYKVIPYSQLNTGKVKGDTAGAVAGRTKR